MNEKEEVRGMSFYHIYLRGNHRENLFYKENDFINTVNRLALSAVDEDTVVWGFELLDNHLHMVIETPSRSDFIHHFRLSFTQWFNKEYQEQGSVGKRHCGCKSITHPLLDGGADLMDALSYVLQNCRMHGLVEDYFNYKWSTIRLYFNPLKVFNTISRKEASCFLPKNAILPDRLKIHESGIIHPQTFVNIEGVEKLFGSKENFYRILSMPSNRELNKKKENEFPPKKSDTSKSTGRKKVSVRDIDISTAILARLDSLANETRDAPKNIIQMTMQEKKDMFWYVKSIFPHASHSQLARILHIPRTTLSREAHVGKK